MYSIVIGIINEVDAPVVDDSATDYYISLEEAKKGFDKMNRDFLYNFLERDLDFYETDKYFYKEIQDVNGNSLFRESYLLKEEIDGMSEMREGDQDESDRQA